MKYYPVALNLCNARVLVAGGGKVAQRKAISLLWAGARIRIISPEATATLKRLAHSGKITWCKREVRKRDVHDADVVIAATDSPGVNKAARYWAKAKGLLVNVVDNPSLSNFISPALLKKDKAIIAVYTDGKEPELSRDLKNFLKENWDAFISYRNRLQRRFA